MPEDNHNESEDQQRADRSPHTTEAPGANIGLLSLGTQPDYHASMVDDRRAGASGAPPPPPAYPVDLLGDPVLYRHGNEPVRVAVTTDAQQKYGNRAVQRFLQRRESNPLAIQRDGYVPPSPSSYFQPPDPAKQ